MREMVIPELEERFPGRLHYAKHLLRVQGLFESDVSERLRGLSFEEWEVELGYLPQGPEIWLTFFASGKDGGDVMARIGSAQEAVISTLGDLHVSGRDEECLEVVVGRKLRERVWKMAAAESCTGGLLSKRITSVAGASDYFECGYVTYSNRAKMELLGVSEGILKAHGAVSEPVALAMAEGARTRAGVDVALALTGVAGPSGGTHEKPVGTVFIACATASGSTVQKYLFGGDRGRIQEAATHAALVLLWRSLLT
jgi:nicotinamide-nucleotide amidase